MSPLESIDVTYLSSCPPPLPTLPPSPFPIPPLLGFNAVTAIQ